MALDLIARAAAAAARSDAASAASKANPLALFSDLPGRLLDPAITSLITGGYAAADSGAATYVCDALATAALAAAHPRFCKADAAGRHFRLAGDFVTVEQGGATGSGNDQPAIQAAINYAAALGIKEIRFTKRAYDLWCPLRTSGGLTYGDPATTSGNGYPIVLSKSVALIGASAGTTLRFLNSAGGTKDTITQTVSGSPWQGGGIYVNANAAGSTGIGFTRLENLILDGTVPCTNPYTNAGSNLTDKGLGFSSNGNYGVTRLDLRNCVVHNFSGELFYGGCFLADSTIVAENVEMYGSNQSAWNPTGLGKVFATNLNAHDSYLASEIITGQGHVYVGCRFANAYNTGAIATQFFTTGYHYTYPNRDTAKPPTFCEYWGCTFENITNFTVSSWTRGKITLIDTSLYTPSWNDRDIHLDIDFVLDQKTGPGITLAGPQTTTTQYGGCPAGVYVEKPRNISLKVHCRRTQKAADDGRYTDLITYQGLIDKDTVRVDISGEVRNAFKVSGTIPTGFGLPLTTIAPGLGSHGGGQSFGGPYDSPAANVAYDVAWPSMSFYPSRTGPYSVTLNGNYGYSNGQTVTFYYSQNSAQVMTFAATGAGMKLPEDRKLMGRGDRLVLQWDYRAATWVEKEYVCTTKQRYTGSATYDAPSIAAGATTTTTVTVTGAAMGDFVDRISLGVSAAGLILSGYVSAANTVTVQLYNPTAGAVDLASTTLAVEVKRK